MPIVLLPNIGYFNSIAISGAWDKPGGCLRLLEADKYTI